MDKKVDKFRRITEHTPMGQTIQSYDVNIRIICEKIEEIIDVLNESLSLKE